MSPAPCPICGQSNPAGKRFCGDCGAALPVPCPACGAANPLGKRFCGDCGESLPAAVAAVPASPAAPHPPLVLETQFSTFQRALPASLQGQLFTQPEGENRVLTILFADLTGSVQRTAGLHPEDAAALVDTVLKAMVDAILSYEGRINRLLGDAVLAFFGTPIAHENDPERAILAALELREAVQKLGLNVTAGINTGEVYLGTIGAEQHREITAQGPVVNLAARLREEATPGQILVGETVYRHTRRSFAFAAHQIQAKGIAEPVAAYEVMRPLPRPEKVRGIDGLRAGLIGRDRELAQLKEALAEVQSGRGQIATIIGEAGVGKSRLIAELKDIALVPGAGRSMPLWLEGRCLDMGITASYWPFLDMLRCHFDLAPEDDEHARGRRITTSLHGLVAQGGLTSARCEEMLPLLGNLLSARFGSALDERLTHAGPEQIKHQTFLALRDLCVALAHQQPLILILEDLHWADTLSLDLIPLLMEMLTLAPLFLICAYRPEREHKCWHLASIATRKCHERFTEVHLKELTAQQSRRLVESLLHIDALPGAVKEQILAKTQGNPFFVEEVVRSLIDAGLIYHEAEVWKVRAEITALAVPENVQSVILSRVDRLNGEIKHVLQSAAVIGRLFQRRLLGQVSQKEAELDHALTELEDRQLIYEERVIPEEEYSFEHVLTQETVYHNILRRRRTVFHRYVAEGIERLYAESLEGYYEQLAHHYDQAGIAEKALEYLVKAGEKARRAYLNDEALGYFGRVLAQVDSGAQATRVHREWRYMALRGLGRVTHALGRVAEAEGHFQEAVALGRDLGRPPRELVRLSYWRADILWWLNQSEAVLPLAQEGLALLGDDTTSLEAALMYDALGMGYGARGQLTEHLASWKRSATLLYDLPYAEELRILSIHMVSAYLYGDKNVAEATRWLAHVAGLAQRQGDSALLAAVARDTGLLRATTGQLGEAIGDLTRGLALGEAVDRGEASVTLVALIETYVHLGDLPSAVALLERTAEHLGTVHRHSVHLRFAWLRGMIELARGAPMAAVATFRQMAQQAQEMGQGEIGVLARLFLGRALLATGDAGEARRCFADALTAHRAAFDPDRTWLFALLSALETTGEPPARLRVAAEHWQQEQCPTSLVPLMPCLADAEVGCLPGALGQEAEESTAPSPWIRHDPAGDCAFSSLAADVQIQAANGRDLRQVNLTAPRLLQPAPAGNLTVQTVCASTSGEQPGIGGLLLWQDTQQYLVLERGQWGAAEIAFRGCLDNQDLVFGRGWLPGERVWLRLERQGSQVRALCSADGQQWFTAGAVEFPQREGEQVGLHAIGMIDRTIYHGSFPEGTSIRLESFEVWTADAN